MTVVDGVLTVIQARTAAARLPRKILLPLGGRPALARMPERVRFAALAGTTVVATTTLTEVDAIEALSADEGFPCFRDDPIDLLDRDLQAARTFDALLVVVSAASHLRRPPSGARTVRNQLVGVRIMRFGEGTGRPCPAASPARPEGE